MLIKTDQSGLITETVKPQIGTEPEYINLGYFEHDIPIGATHYRDGVFLTKPAQPSAAHVWNDAAFLWEITPEGLANAKLAARERINRAWKTAEQGGFEAYGKVFDSDNRAIQRILGAAQAALIAKSAGQTVNINWTCKDNSTLAMDTDMLVQIPVLIAQAGAALHAKCQVLKAQIDAATTIEEIEAITWASL